MFTVIALCDTNRFRLFVFITIFLLSSSAHAKIVHVNKNAPGPTYDGESWATAFTSVQAGIDVSVNGDEVWVARSSPSGVSYRENITLKENVALYGGFAGTETDKNQRNISANETVLNATSTSNTTVMAKVAQTSIDGFTVRNGRTGVFVLSGTATITNCTIRGNYNGVIVNGTATVSRCIINGNDFSGVYMEGGTVTVYSSTISANVDGVYVSDGAATVQNCSISANTGSGVNVLWGGVTTIINSILAFNRFGIARENEKDFISFSHNDVFGNTEADYFNISDPIGMDGNISADPLYVDGSNGDFHLTTGSSCIDAGDGSVVSPESVDMDGKPRVQGPQVDVGAYETPPPAIQITIEATALSAESCQPGNGIPDPGETIELQVTLKNWGYASTSNLVAILQTGDGVIPVTISQNYGVVSSGGAVSRTFALTAAGECGSVITVRLNLKDGETVVGVVSKAYRLGVPLPAVIKSYSSEGLTVEIPDTTTTEQVISIPDTGIVGKVTARIRLSHAYDADLSIALVGPDGTSVPLATERGEESDYGSGATDCSGVFTVFDDGATTAISLGSSPFVGSYRPEKPLSVFNGKPMSGTWTLRITDSYPNDTGILYCWGLDITGQTEFECASCSMPYTASDLTKALSVCSGLIAGSSADLVRLDVKSDGDISLADAACIARKVAGLEANP